MRRPSPALVERANRIFCEGAVASTFSTLLLGRLAPDGNLELCNAGHCPPLLVQRGVVTPLAATGMPLGVFSESRYQVTRHRLVEGDTLFLYTDGLSEATNGDGEEYGAERAEAMARRLNGDPTGSVLERCLDDLNAFQNGAARDDDLTVMMVRRSA